jgi:hypothetical protein
MVGQGKAKDLRPPYNSALPKVKIWQPKTKKWLPLLPGKNFGPEISFGHTIAKSFPDDDVCLIKYAANGTALYNDWAPSGGQQYKVFMATTKAALADLDANKTKYSVSGMLWLQGESDALESKGESYESNLTDFIAHMRHIFNTPEMPFIIARVRNYYGKGPQAKMVRDAQESLANTIKNVAWFDTDDCGELINGGHYNSDGLIEIGKRFAEQYAQTSNETGKKDPILFEMNFENPLDNNMIQITGAATQVDFSRVETVAHDGKASLKLWITEQDQKQLRPAIDIVLPGAIPSSDIKAISCWIGFMSQRSLPVIFLAGMMPGS